MADDETCTVLFNPRCSKCRQARDLLAAEGVEAELVHYLVDTPSRDEIVRIYGLLGIDDPRAMIAPASPSTASSVWRAPTTRRSSTPWPPTPSSSSAPSSLSASGRSWPGRRNGSSTCSGDAPGPCRQ